MNNDTETKLVEIKLVLKTEMSEDELDRFVETMEREINDHLIDGEDLCLCMHTDKVSYEAKKAIKER